VKFKAILTIAVACCACLLTGCGSSLPPVNSSSNQPSSAVSMPQHLAICGVINKVVIGVNSEGANFFFDPNAADTLGTLSDEAQAAGSPFFGLDSDFASENVSQDYPAQLKTLSAMVAACNGLGNTITSVNPNDINHD
jgi:hypothetical protein